MGGIAPGSERTGSVGGVVVVADGVKVGFNGTVGAADGGTADAASCSASIRPFSASNSCGVMVPASSSSRSWRRVSRGEEPFSMKAERNQL